MVEDQREFLEAIISGVKGGIISINKEENPAAEVALGEYIDDNYPGGQSGFIKDIDEEIAGAPQDYRTGLGKTAVGTYSKSPNVNIN